MRIPPIPQVCSGLLCGALILITGCTNPSSQTLDSLTVTASPSTLSVGGASVLKAMAHLSDGTTQDVTSGTTWTLSNTTLAKMTNGALTAVAPGTVTVQAAYVEITPAGTSPASATTTPETLSGSAQITITNQPSTNTPLITWSTPAAVAYGTALSSTQLNATANLAGTFAYTPAAGTMLKTGTQTLSVVFTPTDNKTYSSATATVPLTVNQATPVISWPAPAAITPGTALSATQLNATTNVPGAFTYNPAAGVIPSAGTVQLAATFTPTDTTDYANATVSNTLVVGSGGTNPSPSPNPTGCGGPTINLDSGMSTSTLQSTIKSAPDCSLIMFTAGTYNITSQITIPCPATGLTISGPGVAYPGPYTATLNGSVAGNWGFSFGSCSAKVTIEYLNWDGGEPSGGGGGFLYVAPSTSNLTVQDNFIHGNQASTATGHEYDGLIWFDGSETQTIISKGNTVQWNVFGHSNDGTTSNADCGAISALFSYQGGTYDAVGGYCEAIGVFGQHTNFTINNNIIQYQEEAIKFYECGSKTTTLCYATNVNINYNDISHIHRIFIESQVSPAGAGQNFNDNDVRDAANPSYGSWGFSLAEIGPVSVVNNAMIGNTLSYSAGGAGGGTVSSCASGYNPPYCIPAAFEWWGNPVTAYNNLFQGYWFGGLAYGYIGNATASYNYGCGYYISNYKTLISNEGEDGGKVPPPTEVGNVTGPATCAAVTSAAPVISPTPSGTYSAPVSVTITDTGVTQGGVGPQGNTTIYYTLDGSTPTTSSTACNPTPGSTSCTISVAQGSTINAIGMWGALNQPKSYPSGFGFVPSAVVTASYVSASAVRAPAAKVSSVPASTQTTTGNNATAAVADNAPPAAAFQSLAIVPSAPVVAIGATTQLKAIATLSDGSTKDVTANVSWKSSDLKTIALSSSGLLSGLASGQAILSGVYQGQQASVLATSSMGDIKWSGPIVITQGGTYSGNWQSTDVKTPGVTIATADPVVIQDSHISSSGTLIRVEVKGADLSVRNSLGVALNASVKGQPNGVFLDAASPARLDVENNYMENVRYGVFVHGYSGSRAEQQTIVVRGNRARNLNGLLSNGMGGYLPGEGANQSASGFLQLQDVQAVPGIDLGWNEVVNYPAHSLVSDVIDLYRASGTPNQPLEVHDTYIQGAYPYKPAQDAYQGGGIKTDGAADDTPQDASAFSYIHDNQVVGTVSYGIALTAGHDNIAANNRVISSGLLSDGTKIAAQRVGLVNASAHADSGSAYNNSMHDNLAGWTCWSASCAQQGYRQDQYLPASTGDYSSNSVVSAKQITLEMEEGEYSIWMNKVASAGIKVGPSF